jgi:hypothetical protein
MHGWKTRTFTEKVVMHHRKMGTAQRGWLKARFNVGVKDYSVGNHPLWELVRMFYQMKHRPFIVGGLVLGWGYAWSMLSRRPIALSKELVRFARREQIQRLKRIFA